MNEGELPDSPKVPVGDIIWLSCGDFDRVKVTLRFCGDDLDPDQVSGQLGCEPTMSHRKGDRLPGTRYRRIARTGRWHLSSVPEETGRLEEKLHRLLDRVSTDLAICEDLKMFRHDIFCGIHLKEWNRGGSLSPQLMARLAERDLTLELNVYSTDESAYSGMGR